MLMTRLINSISFVCFLAIVLGACAAGEPIATQPAQPPDEYLANALDWIETHSVKIDTVDWAAVREDALALAPDPQTTADTYPAILFVMKQIGDSVTFFVPPNDLKYTRDFVGLWAFYPEAVIIGIDPGGPAERAGLRVGDLIETINGQPPRQWQGTQFLEYDDLPLQITVKRRGEEQPITSTLEKVTFRSHREPTGQRLDIDRVSVGYIELPNESGAGELYPTLAQQIIREADRAGTCGWIIDLRRISSGDIWSYMAAIGPILGEGEVGGFMYLDGTHDLWKYQGGKVLWNEEERDESLVEGVIYRLKNPMPPVALLTSHATMAAGELAAITFQGRPNVRIFGEPTGGAPFLVYWTGLSDGAWIGVSGAFSMDRTGRVYESSIAPDEVVATDWILFGTDRDPVILAAKDWLLSQPDCARG